MTFKQIHVHDIILKMTLQYVYPKLKLIGMYFDML